MHVIVFELSFVDPASVSEVVLSFALKFAVDKVSFIGAAIKDKFALSSLFAVNEVSLISDFTAFPGLNSMATLLVVLPVSCIHRTFSI